MRLVLLSTHVCLAVSPGQADSLQKAQGNLSMFTVVNGAKILFRLAVKSFVGALTVQCLAMVEAYAGRAYASRLCGLEEYIALSVDMELI